MKTYPTNSKETLRQKPMNTIRAAAFIPTVLMVTMYIIHPLIGWTPEYAEPFIKNDTEILTATAGDAAIKGTFIGKPIPKTWKTAALAFAGLATYSAGARSVVHGPTAIDVLPALALLALFLCTAPALWPEQTARLAIAITKQIREAITSELSAYTASAIAITKISQGNTDQQMISGAVGGLVLFIVIWLMLKCICKIRSK